MPSLKDLRTRIGSVKSTHKISFVLKMTMLLVAGCSLPVQADECLQPRPAVVKLHGIIHRADDYDAWDAKEPGKNDPLSRPGMTVLTLDQPVCLEGFAKNQSFTRLALALPFEKSLVGNAVDRPVTVEGSFQQPDKGSEYPALNFTSITPDHSDAQP